MPRLLLVFLVRLAACASPERQDAPEPVEADNPELQALYEQDQADRSGPHID